MITRIHEGRMYTQAYIYGRVTSFDQKGLDLFSFKIELLIESTMTCEVSSIYHPQPG